VDTAKWFVADEAFERFDAQSELPNRKRFQLGVRDADGEAVCGVFILFILNVAVARL
jgi:hypothetical protein